MTDRQFSKLQNSDSGLVALYIEADGRVVTEPVSSIAAFVLSHLHLRPAVFSTAIKRLEAYDRGDLIPPPGKPVPKNPK